MIRTFTQAVSERSSTSLALTDKSGSINYQELVLLAQSAASQLRDEFGSGGFIPIRAQSTIDFVLTLIGAMYSGNTPVPVETKPSEATLEHVLKKCRASRIIEAIPRSSLQQQTGVDVASSQSPALVMFTSGTTSLPKGVVMSHANILHSCRAIADYLNLAQFRSSAVVLPLHYSYALISQVLCGLFTGGHVHLFSDMSNPFAFCNSVNTAKIEYFCGVPTTFQTLAKAHRLKPIGMPTVKVACTAGAAFNDSLYALVKEIFPSAVFFNNYGMTEACPRISYVADSDPAFFKRSCGRTIEGLEAKVVDPETLTQVATGERGVLAIRGPNVMESYLDEPEQTRKAFTADGFLISGDFARIQDGLIFIEGRIDDVFNVSGEKVSPAEIEAALNSIPEVVVAAVRGFPDELRGSVPYAFITLSSAISKSALDDELKSRLSPIKIPQRYFEVSSLPKTSNGKIIHRLLSADSDYVVNEIK